MEWSLVGPMSNSSVSHAVTKQFIMFANTVSTQYSIPFNSVCLIKFMMMDRTFTMMNAYR